MVIERYDPEWPALFDQIARELDRHLKTRHRIHHVDDQGIPGREVFKRRPNEAR